MIALGAVPALILTSANLNKNKRLENFSILCDRKLVDQYLDLVDHLFQLQFAGDGFLSSKEGRRDTRALVQIQDLATLEWLRLQWRIKALGYDKDSRERLAITEKKLLNLNMEIRTVIKQIKTHGALESIPEQPPVKPPVNRFRPNIEALRRKPPK